jgi:hypothetical protein
MTREDKADGVTRKRRKIRQYFASIFHPPSSFVLTCREEFMVREQLIEAIKKASAGNRLTCEKAHELSEKLKVPLQEIGVLCNELKIKISACQLGCF